MFVADVVLLVFFGLELSSRLVCYYRPWQFWMVWIEVLPTTRRTPSSSARPRVLDRAHDLRISRHIAAIDLAFAGYKFDASLPPCLLLRVRVERDESVRWGDTFGVAPRRPSSSSAHQGCDTRSECEVGVR